MGQSEASEKLVVFFFFLTPQLLFGFASGPRRCLRVFTSSGDAHLRVLQSCLSSLRVRPQLRGDLEPAHRFRPRSGRSLVRKRAARTRKYGRKWRADAFRCWLMVQQVEAGSR